MIKDLQESTDFDLAKASISTTPRSAKDNNILGQLSLTDSQPQVAASSIAPSMAQSSIQPTSNFSKETIDDGARDLLDKYSQMLFDSFK